MVSTFKGCDLGDGWMKGERGNEKIEIKSIYHDDIVSKKNDIPFGFGNSEMRGLCISAYLRCLKAYLQ